MGSDAILYNDSDVEMIARGRTLVVLWNQHTTITAVRRVSVEQAKLSKTLGGPILFMQVVAPTAAGPSSHARTAISIMLRDAAPYVQASAIVVEGDSLRHSIVRTFIIALRIFSKPVFPHNVYSTQKDAQAFLSTFSLAA